jgi:hypothetical protein
MTLKSTNRNTGTSLGATRSRISSSRAVEIGFDAVVHRVDHLLQGGTPGRDMGTHAGDAMFGPPVEGPLRTGPIARGADVRPPLSYRPPHSATTTTPGTINTMVAMVRLVMVSRPK